MMLQFPFGDGCLPLDLDDDRIKAVLAPRTPKTESRRDEAGIIRDALLNPIGSPRLSELAAGKRHIVVITSDHTRPLPGRLTLPPLLDEIASGAPNAAVTVVVATGCHRGTTRRELEDKFGAGTLGRARFVVHDAFSEAAGLADLGPLPSGNPCVVNRVIVETDLLVSEGFIEPHFFAGFSGGCKAVLPGCAAAKTVLANHSAELIADPRARTGVLDRNRLHEDMLHAARRANLAFIHNVALDAGKRIVAAFAGDMEKAHATGCAFVSASSGVQAAVADVVITSNNGYPLDQNLYQTVKCLTAAEASCRSGGVIIGVAECRDGHGGEQFAAGLRGFASPAEALRTIEKRGADETLPDQWQLQILFRILSRFTVIMVTGPSVPSGVVEGLGMRKADSLPEALRIAERITGNANVQVTAIPDGVGVVVKAATFAA
ncbi:MAG: nickel-dependent lactate racemase [Planctomycetota bacterium]|jgi:nickel-dependent lactate racemase|nr:nickel-dependent lactate racemase [Planctomycetota bacterium]